MKKYLFLLMMFLAQVALASENTTQFLKATINTVSGNKTVSVNYTIKKLSDNTNLVLISITNKSKQTEQIKNIDIQLLKTPAFEKDAKLLYAGYDMTQTPLKVCGLNEKQTTTESVLLVKRNNNSFYKVGILSWEIFRAVIGFTKETGIVITAEGENKPIKPGETLSFEKIVVENGTNWQNMLSAYAKQIATVHNIKPKQIGKWKGWGTWDYFGHDFTQEDIETNIKQIKQLNVGANLIQLDASWWINRGDYLETRSNLKGGMKGVAKLIHDNGLKAGLHLDGFRGISTSKVYIDHPNWFLKDQNGNTIFGAYSRNGKAEKRVYFDYSNPEACNYMKNVLQTMTKDWGYDYIKIDFLWFGLNKNIMAQQKDPNLKIVAFDTAMTSMQRSRAGLKAMREGIGEAYFLGCSSVFGPNYGLVDGLRTGPDINPRFESYRTHALQNAGNFFLNKTVVQTDADYIVVRSKEDEDAKRAQGKNKFGGDVSFSEAEMWANYISLFGGIKLSSDDLNLLRPERMALTKKVFAIETCEKYVPIDLWDNAKNENDAFSIMLGENKQGLYLALFNWEDKDVQFNLLNVPTAGIKMLNTNPSSVDFNTKNNELNTKLKGRSSVIFQLNKSANFNLVSKQIQYKIIN